MSGHSTEIFVEVPNRRFICPLCMEVLRDPVQCFDGHLFCRSCVSTSISAKQECPTCKKHLEPGKLAANIAVREMIDEMDVKCSSPKCQWVGKLPDRETHISKYCDFFGVSCTLDGCSEMVPRVELQNHLQHCDFRLISCQHCAESFPFCQLPDHSLVCLQRLVECPNGCENAGFKCCELENHLASTCPMQVIPCLYFQHNACIPGCCGTILRKYMMTHLQLKRCMFLNMDVICRKVVVSSEDQDSRNSKLAVLEPNAFLRKAGVIVKSDGKSGEDDSDNGRSIG